MEEGMPKAPDHPSLALKATEDFLARLRTWWQHHNELEGMDRAELDRIAADLGMTAHDLGDLVARGPDAAALLQQRMTALGLSRSDVERAASGLMRDLERTCTCCDHKGVCEKDLANRPQDRAWKSYCPNAISLDAVVGPKGRSPA
jgi:hypothetical protein